MRQEIPQLYWLAGTFMAATALVAFAWTYVTECCVEYRPRRRGPEGGRWDR